MDLEMTIDASIQCLHMYLRFQRRVAVGVDSSSGASSLPAQPAQHCPARVPYPFSLSRRSLLPPLVMPLQLFDYILVEPITWSPDVASEALADKSGEAGASVAH